MYPRQLKLFQALAASLVLFFVAQPMPCIAKSKLSIFSNGRGLSILPMVRARLSNNGDVSYDPVQERGNRALYRQIRKAGFGFVRLVVTPAPIMANNEAARIASIRQIVSEIDSLETEGLSVVIDIHFWPSSDNLQTSAQSMLLNNSQKESFLLGVTAVAKAIANRDNVLLELLNEPPSCSDGMPDWPIVQRNLVARIRAAAPVLPLLLTGCGGQLDGLLALDPTPYMSDRLIFYTFHFYEPYIFTHQQTFFSGGLQSVPYPPSLSLGKDAERVIARSAAAMLQPKNSSASVDVGLQLRAYLRSPNVRAQIDKRMEMVAGWRARYNINSSQLLLGEFGTTLSFGTDSMRTDELRWLRQVRTQAEMNGYAWSYWSFPKITSFDYDPKQRFIRQDVLDALGVDRSTK